MFRPYPTAESLAKAIERLDTVRPGVNAVRRREAIAALRSPQVITTSTLRDEAHAKRYAFEVSTGICDLPMIATNDVLALLDGVEFKSCLGEVWKKGTNGIESIVPTNESAGATFNIVPPRFQGAFAGNDRFSCIKCHDSTNRHVTEFQQPRGWYGRIRGSDGIFSFHPIALESIATAGGTLRVAMRQELIDAGIVARFNPATHDRDDYRRIRGLQ